MIKAAIIDDNGISRGLLRSVLTSSGDISVVADCNTGTSAVSRALYLEPKIVCVDIGSSKDGAELLDTIFHLAPKALVFVVSGTLNSDLVKAAASKGVHGFIVKPFTNEAVHQTIRNAVIKVAREFRKANPLTEVDQKSLKSSPVSSQPVSWAKKSRGVVEQPVIKEWKPPVDE